MEAGTLFAPPGSLISSRTFQTGEPIFLDDVATERPGLASLYHESGIRALMVAPINAGDRRLGVLAVHSPRTPLFVEDDKDLVQMLASQCAVILETRRLLEEATMSRPRRRRPGSGRISSRPRPTTLRPR